MMPALAACGEDGGTEVTFAPMRLVALSPIADSVTAGDLLDPPISVRVENSLGDPVEGVPVRFLLASGGGDLRNLAVSSRDGIAEAEFQAPPVPGETRIRADIPSATHVRALEFSVVSNPSAAVELSRISGDGQQAETGSQLARAFVIRATTPGGSLAGGVPIAWRVSAPSGGGGRLTADTTYTGAEGRSQVLLTLGRAPGSYVVRAHAAGSVVSDTVSFSVTASDALGGAIVIDSVRPLPLKAGLMATVYGGGFALEPGDNEVWVEGELADVLEAAPGQVRFQVPTFAGQCRPAREVGVRTFAGGESSNGMLVQLEPQEPLLGLALGEARTFRQPSELTCLQLEASDAERQYGIAVQSAARTAQSAIRLRLLVRADAGSGSRGPATTLMEDLPADLHAEAERRAGLEFRLRSGARRELERRRAIPSRGATGTGPSAALQGASAATGDTLRFHFAIREDFTASCADTTRQVEAVVRAAGTHFLLVEDVGAPRSGFGAEDWSLLSQRLNQDVFPTSTLYFGSPADIDGNGRVIALFTPEVNRLTPRGSEVGLGGFFLPLDLAASGRGGGGVTGDQGEICPASNEGEILYLAVPDPDGVFSDPIGVARARRNALGLAAHELQHLINAQRRVLDGSGGFGALEETWLDEGLSQLAEELAGLRLSGLDLRQNLTFEQVAATREAQELFNTFHISNFFQLSLFMLDPGRTSVLATMDKGGLDGLQMRGFSWFFLRWLADQDGSAGGAELVRRVATGGPNHLRGVSNVEMAAGRPWADLLADFAVAVAVDDSGVGTLSERHRVPTWNFRDIFAGLNRNPSAQRRFPLNFPLAETSMGFERSAVDFRLHPAAVRYFSLRSQGPAPALSISVLGSGGDPPTEAAAAQVTVVRTR